MLYHPLCFKIRVNSVNPTVVMTEMGRLGWTDALKAEDMIRRIPLGRFAGQVDYKLPPGLSRASRLIHSSICVDL